VHLSVVRSIRNKSPSLGLYAARNVQLYIRRRRTRSRRKGSINAAVAAAAAAAAEGVRAHRSASKPAADAEASSPRPPGDPVIRFPGAAPTLGDPVSAGDTVTHFAGDLYPPPTAAAYFSTARDDRRRIGIIYARVTLHDMFMYNYITYTCGARRPATTGVYAALGEAASRRRDWPRRMLCG